MYARAGVPEYWIVDLAREAVERFRSPTASGYAAAQCVTRGATLVPEALGAPAVALVDLLDFALGR